MRPRNEARILEAAIELFAESGYAAGARAIAQKGGTTTMTMYRTFRNKKEYLFEEALREVISRSFDPGKFVLFIYEDPKAQDLSAVLLSALQQWYAAMSLSSARLLAYAYLSPNEKWREMADSALGRIISVLATTIERHVPKNAKHKFDARTAAKALIMIVFQTKVTRAKGRSAKVEKDELKEVEAVLNYCLQGLAEL